MKPYKQCEKCGQVAAREDDIATLKHEIAVFNAMYKALHDDYAHLISRFGGTSSQLAKARKQIADLKSKHIVTRLLAWWAE
jgi:hypothetical protein